MIAGVTSQDPKSQTQMLTSTLRELNKSRVSDNKTPRDDKERKTGARTPVKSALSKYVSAMDFFELLGDYLSPYQPVDVAQLSSFHPNEFDFTFISGQIYQTLINKGKF